MIIGLDDAEIAQVSRGLFELQQEFAGQSEELVDTYGEWQRAAREYRVVKANALLRAPIRDPKDSTRKYTADDRAAWVDVQTDVMAAADARLVAELAHKVHAEDVWARKNRLETFRQLSYNARTEANL